MTTLVLLPAVTLALIVGLLFLPVAYHAGYRKCAQDAAEAARLTWSQQAVMDSPGHYRGKRRMTWRMAHRRIVEAPVPIAPEPGPVTQEFERIVAGYDAEYPLIGQPGMPYLRAHMAAVGHG